ncbi:hypothetical protein [Oceanobacillus massiliensis]|uniref:hypothetical protein n=1 Tax=Oceanobacillus massiliensis TaxID=1465765 RepID=UPI0030187E79
MKKKIYVLILLIAIVILIFFLLNKETEEAVTIQDFVLENGTVLTFESEDNIEADSTSEKKYSYGVEDRKSTYKVGEKATLEIVERILPNEDSFIFTRWNNEDGEKGRIHFTMEFTQSNRYDFDDFAQLDIEHEHDKVFGVEGTTYPNGLVKIGNFDEHKMDLMLGKNYVSELLTEDYDDGKKSYIRKLVSEEEDFAINQTGQSISVQFDMHANENNISEQWLMLSNENLFESEEELNKWIERSNKEYKNINAWYTAEGTYSKLPWSIEPFDEMGYGKNILFFRENAAIDRYKEHGEERYYYNLIMNSLINFENYPRNEEKLYETHYTSTWLKELYGTRAPYVDTRHNELGIIYINDTRELLGFDRDEKLLLNYADFLVKQKELNNILAVPDSNGYFIADYYDSSKNARKTHTSLNHVLGEMNLLLQVYRKTDDEKYLEVANAIKSAVKMTEDDWIREDHDLWYEVSTNFEYSGRDYELRTLIDLLDAEILYNKLNDNKDRLFEKLIQSKITYLNSQNIELSKVVERKIIEADY